MKKLTFSALINARLQSTRLPRKMLLPFAGTNLVSIALDKLNRLKLIDSRYFAAAEDELLDVARNYENVKILKRSLESIAPGYNGNAIVFQHCLDIKEDYIIWINACSSMLSIGTLGKAIEHVRKTEFNSYTSVIKTTDWIFDEDGEPVTNKMPSMISTAHSKTYYKVTHAFHILRREVFIKNFIPWALTKNDPALIEIPEEETYDVNTLMEFQIAEAAYSRLLAASRQN